jgi:hypothetical protein
MSTSLYLNMRYTKNCHVGGYPSRQTHMASPGVSQEVTGPSVQPARLAWRYSLSLPWSPPPLWTCCVSRI